VEEFDLLSLLEVHLVTRNESDTRLRSRELLLTAHCRKDSGNSEGGLLTFRLHRFPHLSTFCLYWLHVACQTRRAGGADTPSPICN